MLKVNLLSHIEEASQQAAAATAQRAELQLGFGRCGWLQSEPLSGRVVLQRWSAGQAETLTPPPYSVRSRVHEYGGGAWCLGPSGAWFVNAADQGIYLQPWEGGTPLLWWRARGCRYGDLTFDAIHQRLLAVEEQHPDQQLASQPGQDQQSPNQQVRNRLVAISVRHCRRQVLDAGEDFYAAPSVAPDGSALAWISWVHPFQPWLGTRLHWAHLDASGMPTQRRCLAEGCQSALLESLQQPRFAPDGSLWVISDRSGWWNLYRIRQPAADTPEWQPIEPRTAEYAGAPWQLGARSYAFIDPQRVVMSYLQQGSYHWGIYHVETQHWQPLQGNWGELASIGSDGSTVYALAADLSATGLLLRGEPTGHVRMELPGLGEQVAAASQPVSFAGDDGETVHGCYYPAQHCSGRLLVQLHGGPTAYRAAVADAQRLFWLQQGYAVLELNYRGSSGYGRDYRQRLRQQWGELDAADACAAGYYALTQGWAQPGGLALRGNSSGGYTLLRALQRSDHPFSAAACHYGIGDLARLAATTHKFERRYLDWLIGDPVQHGERYRQRSPMLQPERLSTPVIFFQGAEDRVVPPEQTRQLFVALLQQGIASEYVVFADEGHGFRRAANRAEVLYREWTFYQRQLGIESVNHGGIG